MCVKQQLGELVLKAERLINGREKEELNILTHAAVVEAKNALRDTAATTEELWGVHEKLVTELTNREFYLYTCDHDALMGLSLGE